ncbi:MAG: AAA family ATPase [Thermoplasmata archaeon]|uniref:AAA family ATPase n=1 Tax=Candidatus Sysuiplasma superficiale TaxID=2823368 RepID=A0A8J7YRT3_9ARCH|nr:AAA family ATPase [Candidatus Sysuiplasma superficiale]MBX8643402.1 AAA family ATPase [Candidatus Sysuiplasma superficiale]MCL4347465.1 AAA family ATPase [Candidatus Thermoplasmatota archaeon]MCL5437232.1 AAA family ATPase [Candidatus Thermoplasmatota archaeon]
MKALVLTGMAGAGKTEFANHCRSLGIPVFQMGDLVRETVRRLNLELNGNNIGRVASVERLKYGNDIWARRTARNISAKNSNCIIDGTRSEAEVAYFRHHFGTDALIVTVYASSPIRYSRLRSRGRSDIPLSRGEFEERDRRELGWGLGNAIALSDRILGNEGTIEAFRESIELLLRDIGFIT